MCPYDMKKRMSQSEEGIFNQKSVPMGARFDELMDRPLSIKKKEILIQRKPVSSRARQ